MASACGPLHLLPSTSSPTQSTSQSSMQCILHGYIIPHKAPTASLAPHPPAITSISNLSAQHITHRRSPTAHTSQPFSFTFPSHPLLAHSPLHPPLPIRPRLQIIPCRPARQVHIFNPAACADSPLAPHRVPLAQHASAVADLAVGIVGVGNVRLGGGVVDWEGGETTHLRMVEIKIKETVAKKRWWEVRG